MNKVRILLGLVLLLVIMDVCSAEQTDDVRHSDTLTGGFWGLNDQLADDGIEIGFGITNIYQANVKGGLSTHNKRGRYSGSYDLELTGDTQKLFGIEVVAYMLMVKAGGQNQAVLTGPLSAVHSV